MAKQGGYKGSAASRAFKSGSKPRGGKASGKGYKGKKPGAPAESKEAWDFRKKPQGVKAGRDSGTGQGNAYRKDERDGTDVIAGKHAVLEALESGVPLKRVLIAQGSQDTEIMDKVVKLAIKRDLDVQIAPKRKLDAKAVGLAHQGVIAVARPYKYASVGEIAAACEGLEAALVIVLDHITDVGNLGAIVRSAEVLGASGIIIPNKRSAEVVASTYKTSAGAVSRMKIAKVSNLSNACEKLRTNGFWVAGASEKAESMCWESPMKGRLVLVMGSEGEGLSRLVEKQCDFLVSLPQRGEIGSLNVSCATVSLGYEWLRQSREAGFDVGF